MKTIKNMSIAGLVLAVLGMFMFYTTDYATYISEAEAVAGWLSINSLYLLAFSIVGIVQSRKSKK